MHLLIDANNLAGALGLLEQENFDEKLILIMKDYNSSKAKKITLVFDGVDLMGDKYSEKNITVIYTPRDSYYESADDKIVELAKAHFMNSNDELKVITDDNELKDTLRDQNFDEGLKFKLVQASDFARLLQVKVVEVVDEEELSNEEKNDITAGLLNIWK